MSNFFRTLDWNDWIYGLWVAFIGGGSSAISGSAVVSLKDPLHYNLGAEKSNLFQLIFWIFITAGTVSFFAKLSQNPAPKVITEIKKVEADGRVVTEMKKTEIPEKKS